MAIWKKRNKEESACGSEKGKVFLSDDAMEMVSGGQEDGTFTLKTNDDIQSLNLYSQTIINYGAPH